MPIPCLKGFFCPLGTTTNAYIDISIKDNVESKTSSKLCAPGFYSDVEGLGECKPCPDGFECFECDEQVIEYAVVRTNGVDSK